MIGKKTKVMRAAALAALISLVATLPAGSNASDNEAARVEVGEATFHIHGTALAQGEGLSVWLEMVRTTAGAVARLSGRFPVEEVLVRLKTGSRLDAIGFGRIERGGTPRITFSVRPDASVDELLDDWRGYHEMAHLLIPFPGNRDIWFAEGLASYYQYFMLARAGRLSTEAAWRELVGGFLRGVNDHAGRGQSLRGLAPGMWRQSAFRRVYWTGAAYFLRVDTRLRAESDGQLSVDRALAAFQECCRRDAHNGQWSAKRLIERLGQSGRADIWREEYERMIDAPAAPDFRLALARVGVTVGSEGSVRFNDRPEAIRMREAIAKGHRPWREEE